MRIFIITVEAAGRTGGLKELTPNGGVQGSDA